MAESVIDILVRARDETSRAFGGIQRAAQKTTESLNKLNQSSTARLQRALRGSQSDIQKTREEVDRATGSVQRLSRQQLGPVRRAFQQLGRDIREARARTRELGRSIETVGDDVRRASFAIAALGGAITAPAILGVRTFSEFENTMVRVRAITGATDTEFERLTKTAKSLGETTAFSANQAAETLVFLAQAGFDVEEAIVGIPEVLTLAAAGQLELARAGDIATNIISGLGLEIDQLGRVNDVLVETSNRANTNVEQLGDAFATSAPLAAAFGTDVEEAAAFLGVFANAGFRGERAGTFLRNIFVRLTDDSKEVQRAIKDLGLEIRDAQGNFRSLTDIFTQLAEGNFQLEDATRLFGTYNAAAALAATRQIALVKELTNYNVAADEADRATEQAAKQYDTLKGDTIELRSAIEGLFITIGERLAPTVRELVQNFTDFVRAINAFIKSLGEGGEVLIVTITAIGGVLAVLGTVGIAIGALTSGLGAIVSAFGGAGVAVAGFTGGISGITSALVILAPVLAQIGVAVGALVVGMKAAGEVFEFFGLSTERIDDNLERIAQKAQETRNRMSPLRDLIAEINQLGLGDELAGQLEFLSSQVFIGRIDSAAAQASLKGFLDEVKSVQSAIEAAEEEVRVRRAAKEEQDRRNRIKALEDEARERERLAKETVRLLNQTERELTQAIKNEKQEQLRAEQQFSDERKRIAQEAGGLLRSLEEERADIIRSQLPEAAQQRSLEAESSNALADALERIKNARTQEELALAKTDIERARRLQQRIPLEERSLEFNKKLSDSVKILANRQQELLASEQVEQRDLGRERLQNLEGALAETQKLLETSKEEVRRLKEELKTIGDTKVQVNTDVAGAEIALARLQGLLTSLTKDKKNIEILATTDAAENKTKLIKAAIDEILEKKPTIEFGAEDQQARESIANLISNLDELPEVRRVVLEANAERAREEITEVEGRIQGIRSEPVDIRVAFDQASQGVAQVQSELDSLKRDPIQVEAQIEDVSSKVAALQATLDSIKASKVTVEADTAQATLDVTGVQRGLAELKDVNLSIAVNIQTAVTALTAISSQLTTLQAATSAIDISANTAPIESSIDRVQFRLSNVQPQPVTIEANITEALSRLVTVEEELARIQLDPLVVEVDIEDARLRLREIQLLLEDIQNKEIAITSDVEQAQTALAEVQTVLDGLKSETISVSVDAQAAQPQLDAIDASLTSLGDRTLTVEVIVAQAIESLDSVIVKLGEVKAPELAIQLFLGETIGQLDALQLQLNSLTVAPVEIQTDVLQAQNSIASVQSALAELEATTVPVNADITTARTNLTEIDTLLSGLLMPEPVRIQIDVQNAIDQIHELETHIGHFLDLERSITITATVSEAVGELREAEQQLRAFDALMPSVEVEVIVENAQAAIESAQLLIDSVRGTEVPVSITTEQVAQELQFVHDQLENLPTFVQVHIHPLIHQTEDERTIASFQAEIDALQDRTVTVTSDTTLAQANLTNLKAALDLLVATDPIVVPVDTLAASTAISALSTQLSNLALAGAQQTVVVDGDISNVTLALTQVRDQLTQTVAQAVNNPVVLAADITTALASIASVQTQLSALMVSPVQVDADIGPAQLALSEIERLILSLRPQPIPVTLDTEQANLTVRDFEERFAELEDKQILVTAETTQAEQAIADVQAALDALQDKTITVTVRTVEERALGGFAGSSLGATRLARGGKLPGFGGGDRVKALLEPGEFVVRKERARMFGSLLQMMNSGSMNQLQTLFKSLPRMRLGGPVPAFNAGQSVPSFALPRFQFGGLVDDIVADAPTSSDVSDRIAVDLSVDGAGIGEIFGDRETVDRLIQALTSAGRTSALG